LKNTLKDPDVLIEASSALLKLDKQAAPEVFAALFNALKQDPFLHVRAAAATALGEIEWKYCVPEVIYNLIDALKDQEHSVRTESVCALGKLNPTEVITHLINALGDTYPDVRTQAVSALGKLKPTPPDVITHLINALKDRDQSVRTQASNTLVQLVKESQREASAVVTDTNSPKIKTEASSTVVITALIYALEDTNRDFVKTNAAVSLVKLGNESPEVISVLIKTLTTNPDLELKILAVTALGDIGERLNRQLDYLFDSLPEKDILFQSDS
jgi:HEAT repeat protein